ncbi:hypothetical protein HMI54_015025 [Coelomomyces lativittatus]|nr:hypothetical protein HMI55_003402 [Coelomomyces lativittatus]KAJ1510532.1 hypothetical protein HMI56_006293 [Coelomomyces lativittatus]KAJ1513413.1 hypothetical protein HMI54_015025 [Coelomomyces lativittatus]
MSTLAYALSGLCVTGGTMGYLRKKSVPSLIAGVSLGSLYGVSGYFLQNGNEVGSGMALCTSLLLLCSMLPKAIKTKAPVPMAMSTFGLVGTFYYTHALFQKH